MSDTKAHEAVYLDGTKIDWKKPPPANKRVKWTKKDTGGDPITGSLRTICHLNRLNNLSIAKYGTGIQVIQPPYNTTVPASAGTHDYDACVDLYIPGQSWWGMQRFLRANGLGCWYRHKPAFGNHIHGFTLPPWDADSKGDRSRDFVNGGFKVGKYVDGGWSTAGKKFTSSQTDDYYAHAYGLAGEHKPGSDKTWFPPDIRKTIFNLDGYIARRQ